MKARAHAKHARFGAIFNIALVVLAVASVSLTAALTASRRRQPPPPDPMTNRELEVALRRAEISPESLAALGFSASQTTALISRARQTLGPAIEAYRSAHSTLGSARVQADGLERLVRSGLASEHDVTGLMSAKSAQAAAIAAMDTQHAGLRSASLGEDLQPAQSSALQTFISTKAWASLPAQYRFRSGAGEAQWVALRDALFEHRSALAENRAINQAAQTVLDDWNGIQAVGDAHIALQQRLPEVATAWNAELR